MRSIFTLLLLFLCLHSFASGILIPMDTTQKNHLKAYGLIYKLIEKKEQVNVLVNYRGGSYLVDKSDFLTDYCQSNGISFENKSRKEYASLLKEGNNLQNNQTVLKLDHLPKIGFYETSGYTDQDVVEMLFNYAGIPYTLVTEAEILEGKLAMYDWLYVHHEDFTGQYGKFYSQYQNADWYKKMVQTNEKNAKDFGYTKVSEMKLDVAKEIKSFIGKGGFMFSMCSATETFDIALAAEGIDINDNMYDGDGFDIYANTKLHFENCLAFKDFTVNTNGKQYDHSSIDKTTNDIPERMDFMNLKKFNVSSNLMEALALQNHANTIKGFWGQTTCFDLKSLKENVTVLVQREDMPMGKMIMGNYGKGYFTFMGGHDPGKYRSFVGSTPEIEKNKNLPGYRVILNNLFLPSSNYPDLETAQQNNEISLSVAPNPFTNSLTLTINQSAPKNQAVYVTDVNGKQVKFVAEREFQTQEQLNIDLLGLNTGIYFVFLRDDTGTLISKKIVKL